MGDCGDSPDNCSNSQWGSGDGLATGGVIAYTEAEEPLDRFGEDAVERWFTEEEVDELIEFTESLAA